MYRRLTVGLSMALGLTSCVDISMGFDSGAPAMPDLAVVGFWYENAGDNYIFTVEIENQGEASADSFAVDLYLDRSTEPRLVDQGDATEMVLQGVAVDDIVAVSFTVPSTSVCEKCSTWVFADSNDQVEELYEDNNTAGPSVILYR